MTAGLHKRENPMKLYWAPQSRSIRALWLMEEAGVPYERVVVDIRKGAQNTPEYRAVNPMMKVPALTDGEASVAESGALCAYVAERVPEAGLAPPVGDPQRGAYLRWLFFGAGCVEAAFLQKMKGVDLPVSSAGWGSYERVIAVIDEAVAKGPWLLGERFSAPDILIGADLWFGINLLKVLQPTEAIAAYVDRCTARPAYQRAMAINAAGA